jgi:cell division cycle 14
MSLAIMREVVFFGGRGRWQQRGEPGEGLCLDEYQHEPVAA